MWYGGICFVEVPKIGGSIGGTSGFDVVLLIGLGCVVVGWMWASDHSAAEAVQRQQTYLFEERNGEKVNPFAAWEESDDGSVTERDGEETSICRACGGTIRASEEYLVCTACVDDD